ncbi:MAG TPA: hypothetical protein DCM71_03085, partial [Runella sp.]|nr:hypothetical protein [Runella sp.]
MKGIIKYKLKSHLTKLLKEGNQITLNFQCGNDEAYIVPFINGDKLDYDELYFNLEEYIMTELDLPSAGQNRMDGTGELLLIDNDIFLDHKLEGYIYEYNIIEDENEINDEVYEPGDNEGKYFTIINHGRYLLLPEKYDIIPSELLLINE